MECQYCSRNLVLKKYTVGSNIMNPFEDTFFYVCPDCYDVLIRDKKNGAFEKKLLNLNKKND